MKDSLVAKIADRSALIGVIGMGYVGLPLALLFGERCFRVLGFDVDAEKVAKLNRGECYIRHVGDERVAEARRSGRLETTSEFVRLKEPDALLICVPTPLTPQRDPDMSYIESTSRQICAALRKGQLVVLESTTYPGTTDELLKPMLEETGLVCGKDFFLAFSPEREDPGNPRYGTSDIPKVVGGVDDASAMVARALYEAVITRVVPVSSARTAEAAKLMENIFRAVNIALVNELKVIYDRMGIDIWEVLEAASTKPFGFMRFNPGPGWGGHCIPLDPFYLAWKAREYGVSSGFIERAGEVNIEMPRYVIGKLQEALNRRGKPLKGSRILLLGVAYKKDIDDPRESPAFELIHLLRELEARVSYHDPHVLRTPPMRTWPDLVPMESTPLTASVLRSMDAALIVTDHTSVDYELVARECPLVVDTRGIYRDRRPNVVKA